VDRKPVMLGFQAAGAAPLVSGQPVANPETLATAIRIGNPARWTDAENAVKNSHGLFRAVTDEEIIAAYQDLAGEEGVFVEPASAASLAGVYKLIGEGYFGDKPATIVCTVTGHGLKDPDTAVKYADAPEKCGNSFEDLVGMLGL
jgi:threonine synthase